MSFTAPQRIVCLSAESADWLWRIGAWDRVVGITAYCELPPEAPLKPRVSGFSTANVEKIKSLEPDLIITFSDVQTALANQLTQAGCNVLSTDPRTLTDIESTLALLARTVGCEAEAEPLLKQFREALQPVEIADELRPRVYFEEWNDPYVAGIAWISELIERAGGRDVFAELRSCRAARDRQVTDAQIIAADPEIMFASWCGKPFREELVRAREGWQSISAVQNSQIHSMAARDILQPGFTLIRGYRSLRDIIDNYCAVI